MMLPRACVAALLALASAVSPSAASPAQASPRPSVTDIMRADFPRSYITLGAAAIDFPGSDLRADSAAQSFEARVAPRFAVFRADASRWPVHGAWMLTVDADFTVRRLQNIPSNPVRTPDYAAGATLYHAPNPLRSGAGLWYVSSSLFHRSNGQSGDFGDVRPDGGRLNDVDGSFSLWGADAALHRHGTERFLPRYRSIRLETFFRKEGELNAVYPDVAISLEARTLRFRHAGWAGFSGDSRLATRATWFVPNGSDAHESLKPSPFAYSLTVDYAPDWRPAFLPFPVRTGDFSAFARLYLGADPYNMNFNKQVYRIDFGVMAIPY